MDGPLWQELSELRRQDLLEEAERARLVNTALGRRPRRTPNLRGLAFGLLAFLARRPVPEQAPLAFPGAGGAADEHRRVPPGARRCRSRAA